MPKKRDVSAPAVPCQPARAPYSPGVEKRPLHFMVPAALHQKFTEAAARQHITLAELMRRIVAEAAEGLE